MDKKHKKICVVTGASRGLGAAMAEVLATQGYHIIALARTVGGLEELDNRIQKQGGQATLVPVDLGDDNAMAQICRSIFERWSRVDLLVHAAIHAPPLSPVDHQDVKDLDKTLTTNIRATARLITNMAPLLAASSQAHAVFFDDPAIGKKFHSLYGMSKAAQMNLACTWQEESATCGPDIHILSPNPMPTALRARFYPGEARDMLTSCKQEALRLVAELSLE